MPSNTDIIVAFDLYGTLLSTESIAKELSTHFGDDKARSIATLWRRYQLEYTWRLNSMNLYTPFSTITQTSLHHALSDHSLSLPSDAIDSLMQSYDSLSTFPDVGPALDTLSSLSSSSSSSSTTTTSDNSAQRITPVIFSNGTTAMLSASLTKSPSLSPYAHLFAHQISVHDVKKFKPHPDVYKHLAQVVGKDEGEMRDMWLVSGNPFDVVGARAVGMKAAWVDRKGDGWTDALVAGEVGRPTVVVRGLGEVVDAVRGHAEGRGGE